ncbi:hypothetical protein D3OALGA1CA_2455 [Olavius algarvensis associated proteobacterium Delta 3]|nr:hypothetical protein D3OALGA1CA_2455 [Olavius algarvensis associated proteobacterium Delta 3]
MQEQRTRRGLLIILAGAVITMVLSTRVDYSWTVFLGEHRWPFLVKVMGQTVFEGESFGGVDPVILFLITVTGVYYLTWKTQREKLIRWRPHLGFILTCAVVGGIYVVHSLKWIMGRARPEPVITGGLPFTEWFTFGPHFVTEGIYRGAFPSGHTAEAMILFTLAYVFAGTPGHSIGQRVFGWCWGVAALVYASAVGIGRCMALSHWLTDVTGAIVLSWIACHVLFHHVLRVPEQIGYVHTHGQLPDTPPVWELRLCGYLLGVVLGGAAGILGLRGIGLGESTGFIGLALAGALLALLAAWRMALFYRRVRRGLNPPVVDNG